MHDIAMRPDFSKSDEQERNLEEPIDGRLPHKVSMATASFPPLVMRYPCADFMSAAGTLYPIAPCGRCSL